MQMSIFDPVYGSSESRVREQYSGGLARLSDRVPCIIGADSKSIHDRFVEAARAGSTDSGSA
jgi:hypothetical protein